MIFVDYKKGADIKRDIPQEFVDAIRKIGVPSEKSDLMFGDFCFEGHGPDGTIGVGIERKSLHDMMNCIDDARFGGHQRLGMKQMYGVSVLLLEGHWKPHDPGGFLMEGFSGGYSWGHLRHRQSSTMYNKLYRYLISVALSGVIITLSRDLFHSAYNVCEWYHYFQKPWHLHTSLKELHKIAIPTMTHKPPLVRKWANDIEGIGTKLSEDAERLFGTPIKLATSDEQDWLRIRGLGVNSAQRIIRQIWGLK